MPAIVLRMSFKRFLGKHWTKEDLVQFLSKDFKRLSNDAFQQYFLRLHSGGMEQTDEETGDIWGDRMIASFTFGTSGEVQIGMLESLYPDCHEFWICSTKASNCIKGRHWIIKKTPSVWCKTKQKIINDFLFLEGEDEVPREKMVSNYAIKNGLNMGLLVNFIVLLSKSIYEYSNTSIFNYGLPSLVFGIWISALILTILYYRRKIVYIVREE